jgi:S-DNA-T family DNA segregation ATPase FtsK/SpoIIIE
MLITDNNIILFLIVFLLISLLFIFYKKKKLFRTDSSVSIEKEIEGNIKSPVISELSKRDVVEVPFVTAEESIHSILNNHSEIPPVIFSDGPVLNIETEDLKNKDLVEIYGLYDPTLDLANYKYPVIDLLEEYQSNLIITEEELDEKKLRIVSILKAYGIEIEKIKVNIGPTITLYEITLPLGVRVSKIKNLENDIALSLGSAGTRVMGHIPGTNAVGIEVANENPDIVSIRSVIATEQFQMTTMDLPIILGKTMANNVFIADLAKLPHLLIGGATGQGKSVAINALLMSLLYKKHPSQLKFVLIDISKLELTLYNKITHHFLAKLPGDSEAIITNGYQVINTLNSLCIELDERYALLKDAQVRSISEYNKKFINRKLNPNNSHRFLPFIVILIDEFSELISNDDSTVESLITRISQLGRSAGIHLVISTQRPTVNIITGTIKANFPSRIAFRTSSIVDSKTILDTSGAEHLKGHGDMLFSNGTETTHLQGSLVSTVEVERVVEFIGHQRGYLEPYQLPDPNINQYASLTEFDLNNIDSLFDDAARLIVMHQQASTSLIQRKLKLGYNRTGRIIDQLEAAGIVGAFEGSKSREVLIPDEYSLEKFLKSMYRK